MKRVRRKQEEEAADEAKMVSTNQLMQKDVVDYLAKKGQKLNKSFLQKPSYKVLVRPDSSRAHHAIDVTRRAASTPHEGPERRGPRPTTHGAVPLSYTQKLHSSFAAREPRKDTPGTARRGLPMPDYPWATPERSGMGYLEPPKTGECLL